MNKVILSQSTVCGFVSDLLCADYHYVEAVMDSGRIDYDLRHINETSPKDSLLFSIIQNGLVRMSDIIDGRVLYIFAHALFFPTEDKEDISLLEMHRSFIGSVINRFGDATKYGEEIEKRCTTGGCHMKDILDIGYLGGELQDLQTYIDVFTRRSQ
jgi:hypothetical protein